MPRYDFIDKLAWVLRPKTDSIVDCALQCCCLTGRRLCLTGKSVASPDFLSSPSRKNISLNPSGKSELGLVPSCPTQRGVSRTSRTSGQDAVDAAARETGDANADGEVVWS